MSHLCFYQRKYFCLNLCFFSLLFLDPTFQSLPYDKQEDKSWNDTVGDVSLLVGLARVELGGLHHLAGGVHEADGAGRVVAGEHLHRRRHHEPPAVVLHLVLQERRDADVDVLEEVQNGVSEHSELEVSIEFREIRRKPVL